MASVGPNLKHGRASRSSLGSHAVHHLLQLREVIVWITSCRILRLLPTWSKVSGSTRAALRRPPCTQQYRWHLMFCLVLTVLRQHRHARKTKVALSKLVHPQRQTRNWLMCLGLEPRVGGLSDTPLSLIEPSLGT